MKITVRFAGYYRTLAGRPSLDLELAEGATVEDALARLNELLEGRFHDVFFRVGVRSRYPTFLILIDTQIVDRETMLREGNVMAIVPPMAGGQL
ncbi:MAG: MoaD/ThiS family protein [Anaerolineae bacterium]